MLVTPDDGQCAPTLSSPVRAVGSGGSEFAGASSMSAAGDQNDDMPAIMPTILSLGITGLPTIPTIFFYLGREK
jgi:hypothetical protein